MYTWIIASKWFQGHRTIKKIVYSWPFVAAGSSSVASTMDQKYSGKKNPESSQSKTWICHTWATIYIAFTLHFQLFTKHLHCTRYYKWSRFKVCGRIHQLYANTSPFYIRGLSILNVGICGGGKFWVDDIHGTIPCRH